MEQLTISSESFQQALAWINGTAEEIPERDVASMIRSLNRGFREAFRRRNPTYPVPRVGPEKSLYPPTLSSIAGEETARLVSEAAEKEKQTAAEIDSAVLINAIAHVCRSCGQACTQSRAQIILFCIYGACLAGGKGRLPIEHPQAWRYGPVFPRAYKKSRIDDARQCSGDYSDLCHERPELTRLLYRKSVSMMCTPMSELTAVHKGPDSPYGITVRENPEKWGTQIADKLIGEFFEL